MRLRLPHPFALLLACVFVAAVLSYILPAGRYERRDDPATGRQVVVAGTYHRVPAQPVGPFQALVAVPRGLTEAASVVFVIFLVGSAFFVVDRTGALQAGADRLVHALADRKALVIPIVSLVFAVAGLLIGLQEEIVGLVPVLLLLSTRLGYDGVTAVGMSLGPAVLGGAFSPLNPFGVGIAQKLAELPLVSAAGFRMAVLIPVIALWIAGTMRHARRVQTLPAAAAAMQAPPLTGRHTAVLLIVLAGFAVYVVGALRFDWGFDEMSALFLLVGMVAGAIGGLGAGGTADAFIDGFRAMAGAALLVGVARSIYVVLEQGQVVDTIVHGMVTPLEGLPASLSALGMMAVQTVIHVPVPSTSGQAVLTIPILVPLSDLIGLSRQVTVLAYQYGAGACDLLTPTNGALMAVLTAAGVRYESWLRFALPLFFGAMAIGAVGIVVAVMTGLR